LAGSASAAAQAAAKLGFPAVLKIASPDIAHKSEIGGVEINLASRKETSQAFTAIMGRTKRKARRARIEGALVAPMISGGVECILGTSLDPGLGPVIMFGMGGIYVEIYKDVSFRLAPFGTGVAMEMIREIKGYPILAGARGGKPADIGALAKALSRLSIFAAANAQTVQSIDINPFTVLPKGKGAMGLDALIEPLA
ncbi:MAG: acetate--CoA ligase family protein, partial [Rhodospirillales bacterium]|nr:acetate--CoA ligase family protein [Rhodospirillales bacterium]